MNVGGLRGKDVNLKRKYENMRNQISKENIKNMAYFLMFLFVCLFVCSRHFCTISIYIRDRKKFNCMTI